MILAGIQVSRVLDSRWEHSGMTACSVRPEPVEGRGIAISSTHGSTSSPRTGCQCSSAFSYSHRAGFSSGSPSGDVRGTRRSLRLPSIRPAPRSSMRRRPTASSKAATEGATGASSKGGLGLFRSCRLRSIRSNPPSSTSERRPMASTAVSMAARTGRASIRGCGTTRWWSARFCLTVPRALPPSTPRPPSAFIKRTTWARAGSASARDSKASTWWRWRWHPITRCGSTPVRAGGFTSAPTARSVGPPPTTVWWNGRGSMPWRSASIASSTIRKTPRISTPERHAGSTKAPTGASTGPR